MLQILIEALSVPNYKYNNNFCSKMSITNWLMTRGKQPSVFKRATDNKEENERKMRGE